MQIAVCRDRWFFLEFSEEGYLLRFDDPRSTPIPVPSPYKAAIACLRSVGRAGNISAPMFWGDHSDEWCPGCGMGKGAFRTSLTFAQASAEMAGQTYFGHPSVMVHRGANQVARYMNVHRNKMWELHCAECAQQGGNDAV